MVKKNIDFVCVVYAMRLPWMRPYIINLVRSIHKYVKNIDPSINIFITFDMLNFIKFYNFREY